MRWPVFAIAAFVVLLAQISARSVLTINSAGGLSPDLIACLLVFIALFAHRQAALWTCWMMGLLIDLTPPQSGLGYPIMGQYTLGYLFGGYVVLQLRTMVFRRRTLTVAFLTFLFLLAAGVAGVFLLALRSHFYAAEAAALPTGALSEFWRRMLLALYSGVIALPMGWLLLRTAELWGFQGGGPRRH